MRIVGNSSSGGKRPATPTIGTATASSGAASVPFTPSTYIGKGTITYTATSSPGNITGSSASSPITVSGLTNGTAYTFTVVGNTNYGVASAASAASNSVTPAASGPTAYTVSVTPFNATANAYAGSYIDSSGNLYAAGAATTSTSTAFRKSYLTKVNNAGSLQFKNELTVSAGDTVDPYGTQYQGYQTSAMDVDSSGNVYIVKVYGSTNGAILMKFNESGTYQWQKSFQITPGALGGNITTVDVRFFSSNVYVLASRDYGQQAIVKFAASNGAFVSVWGWDGSPPPGEEGIPILPSIQRIGLDSSGNIYAGGMTRDIFGNGNSIASIKLNSSGTFQWCSGVAYNFNYTIGMDVDSSGNQYMIGNNDANQYPIITKRSTSGSLLWARTNTYRGYSIGDISVAPNGTIHAVFMANTTSSDFLWIAYDTNGTQLFAYDYSYTGTYTAGTDGFVKIRAANDYVYISGNANGGRGIFAKLNVTTPATSFTAAGLTFTRVNMTASSSVTPGAISDTFTVSNYASFYSATNAAASVTVTTSPLTMTIATM